MNRCRNCGVTAAETHVLLVTGLCMDCDRYRTKKNQLKSINNRRKTMTLDINWDKQDEAKAYFILNQITSALYYFNRVAHAESDSMKQSFKDRIKELVDEIVTLEKDDTLQK